MFVLERLTEENFRRVGTAPDWCAALYTEAVSELPLLSPAERFPFIEHFLEEAEAFWNSGQDGVLRSPNWIETDAAGEDHYLDAMAVNVGKTRLLIINLLGIGGAERQALLQKGREKQLQYEQELSAIRRQNQDPDAARDGAT